MRLESIRPFVSRTTARRLAHAGFALAIVAALPGCSAPQGQSEGSSYLIVDSVLAASGAVPGTFTWYLNSDVITKKQILGDTARVTLRLAMSDPGSVTSPSKPSTTNVITVNSYRVQFRREDGSTVEGVDVPYGFTAGMSMTITDTATTFDVTLVPAPAKAISPLKDLVFVPGVLTPPPTIPTVAEMTFYGTDQAGHAVTVTARINVTFADWADPS